MEKVLAVARNTFREAVRDRILYGFLFFAVCLILFSLVIGQLSLNEEVRATIDIGMAGISFFSVLMAIFLGITLLHKEIEKRTLYTVLSRPISRSAYVLGKFLGLVATMFVQIGLMTIIWLIVIKAQGGSPSAGIAAAMVLVCAETVLMIALAMFFTAFSSPFLSGLFCLGLFVAGRNAEFLSALAQRKGMEAMAPLLNGTAAVIPNFNLFYPSGKLVEGAWATVHGQFVQSGYMASTLAYGAAYTTALIIAAMVLMERRDFV
ncbi:MAG: ABC transporter permease [Myxococcota bacterium]|jgi:ABC-type transport system involved in multi-copper enzyme maturation permease subunit|nr:ABC transporter permease [Myxococcota bacterium]